MRFVEWLQAELDTRGWSQNELARRMRISSGRMSMIMTEQRGFRADFCRELARVLKLPETVVLEAAGMLGPARTQEELTLRELYELMRELPTEDQRAIVAEARARYEKRKG